MRKPRAHTIIRTLLILFFLASATMAVFLLATRKEKETWSTIAGLLAVVVAVIAVYPTLRVLEIQEDALRPRPQPFFDFSSRYSLLQLRVRNISAGVAYEVRLKWKIHPMNHEGKEVVRLDHIPVLLPQQDASILIGPAHQMVKEFSGKRFEGDCEFKDASGKKYCDPFLCTVEGHEQQLVHDEELPKTLRDLQDIPKELSRIADYLQRGKQS